MPAPRSLTLRERRFADEYLVDFNLAAALQRAGYRPSMAENGGRILARPGVRAHLEPRLAARLTELGHPPAEGQDVFALAALHRRDRRTPKSSAHREAAFIESYLKTHNLSAAARAAGYAPRWARTTGCKLMARPRVRAEVERRMGERAAALSLESEQVLRELAAMAFSTPLDLFDEEGRPIPVDRLPPHVARAYIVRVEGPPGAQTITITSPPKVRALAELWRRLNYEERRGAVMRKLPPE